MALPRDLRFPDRRAIERTLRRGRRFSTPFGQVVTFPADNADGRILFIISKRVLKKSTARNQLKRKLDEWVRRRLRPGPRPRHVIVFISPETATLRQSDVFRRAYQALERVFPLKS